MFGNNTNKYIRLLYHNVHIPTPTFEHTVGTRDSDNNKSHCEILQQMHVFCTGVSQMSSCFICDLYLADSVVIWEANEYADFNIHLIFKRVISNYI